VQAPSVAARPGATLWAKDAADRAGERGVGVVQRSAAFAACPQTINRASRTGKQIVT